jgi:hypothetical protein
MQEPKRLIDYILQDPVLNLSGWVRGDKNGAEAFNPCAYNRFEWGSDGYVGTLDTMDLFGATLSQSSKRI